MFGRGLHGYVDRSSTHTSGMHSGGYSSHNYQGWLNVRCLRVSSVRLTRHNSHIAWPKPTSNFGVFSCVSGSSGPSSRHIILIAYFLFVSYSTVNLSTKTNERRQKLLCRQWHSHTSFIMKNSS